MFEGLPVFPETYSNVAVFAINQDLGDRPWFKLSIPMARIRELFRLIRAHECS